MHYLSPTSLNFTASLSFSLHHFSGLDSYAAYFASTLLDTSPIINVFVNYSIFRLYFSLYQAAASLSENKQLLSLVVEVVEHILGDSKHSSYFSDDNSESRSAYEVLTIAFAMIGEVYSRVGASLPVEIWKSTVEVCVH